ncbi:unnamed protein product [Closterium sp. NIES-65]|nr:unnamed protein product [Closterium sp. NIES-65]
MILTVTLRAAYVACSQPPLPLLASRASLDKASIRKGTDPVNCNDPLVRAGALNAEPSKARTDPFDRLGTNTVLNTSGNDDVRNDVTGDARDDDGGIPLDPLRDLRPSLIGSTWQRESWRRKKRPVKTPRRPEKARPSLVEEIATAWSNDRRRRRDGRWMVDTPRGIPMCPRADPPCPDCRGSGRVECTRCCGRGASAWGGDREVGRGGGKRGGRRGVGWGGGCGNGALHGGRFAGDDVMGWGVWMQWWARLGSGVRGDEGGTHPMPWWRGEGGTHPMPWWRGVRAAGVLVLQGQWAVLLRTLPGHGGEARRHWLPLTARLLHHHPLITTHSSPPTHHHPLITTHSSPPSFIATHSLPPSLVCLVPFISCGHSACVFHLGCKRNAA